jgi:hypothetical protein
MNMRNNRAGMTWRGVAAGVVRLWAAAGAGLCSLCPYPFYVAVPAWTTSRTCFDWARNGIVSENSKLMEMNGNTEVLFARRGWEG